MEFKIKATVEYELTINLVDGYLEAGRDDKKALSVTRVGVDEEQLPNVSFDSLRQFAEAYFDVKDSLLYVPKEPMLPAAERYHELLHHAAGFVNKKEEGGEK